MRARFTLTHEGTSQVIAEPGGWQGHEIVLERHPEFCSLVESIATPDKLVFIGNDNEDGDGGIDFIRTAENGGAVDEKIEMLIEYADDDVTFEEYFRGLLQLEDMLELPDNELEVPIIRDDPWTTFLKRWDTPVDVTSNTDIDGNAADPLEPVTINLTPQKIRQIYHAHVGDSSISYAQFTNNTYYQIDFNDVVILDEIKTRYTIPRLDNTELPAPMFSVEYGGSYTFDIRIEGSHTDPGDLFTHSLKTPDDYIDYYIQFGNQSPIAFDWVDDGVGDGATTIFTYNDTHDLIAGTSIRIYGQANINSTNDLNIGGGSGTSTEFKSYCKITGATTYPETQVQGFWLHDLFAGILARMGPGYEFYSEALGSQITKVRQYDSEGCYSNFVCIKGMHLRGYGLASIDDDATDRYDDEEKPFFMSFKECWDGANPIFNLGLGYETLEESPDVKIIRIEEKAHFYDDSATSVNFSHVYDITRGYDKSLLFKKITAGYNKWESEGVSGIDDPQTKHIYSTRLKGVGKDIPLTSGFIAASLTTETTRRTTILKSSDYKYDNDTFIIATNPAEVSPESYNPELDENFDSIDNLLYSDSRYNLILTPLRNVLRWANYLTIGLQSYLNSAIKFQSGEGNFDMQSSYDCVTGSECLGIICTDELTESQNIDLGSSPGYDFDFLHLALLYNIRIPMALDEYKLIDRKKPIGISQTASAHKKFFIKQLRYDLMNSEAVIQAWPKEYFEIRQIDMVPEMECDRDTPAEVVYDVDYQAVLDYAELQGYTTPSDAQKLIESNALTSMKAEGIWDDLDLFYHFETDGDENFAMINWKSPGTNNLTKNGTVTFTALQGFTGDGATGYLDTGWNPTDDGVNFTLDESGVFVKINNECTAGNLYQYGVSESSDQSIALAAKYTGGTTHRIGINSTTVSISSNGTSAGLFHIRRVADNDLRIYRDGVQVGSTSTQASTSMVIEQHLALLAFNANGTIAGHSNAQIGIFGIGASITGKESALNTIFNS